MLGGGGGYDSGSSIIATDDGGYVSVGYTESFGAGDSDAYIAKFTIDGTLEWDKTWGGIGSDWANSVIANIDGGYAMVGNTYSFGAGNYDAFIAKFASDGALVWDKTWGGANYDRADSIIVTADGGFVIAGQTESFGVGNGKSDAFIAKYDSDGTLEWDKTWGGIDIDWANSIIATTDSGFVITGNTYNYSAGNYDVFLAKYASDGTMEWDKTWGGTGRDDAGNIITTANDDLVITGETNSFGAGNYDAFLARFTSDGTLIWDKTWGGVQWDWAFSVATTTEGSLVLAGFNRSFVAGDADAFLAKFTSDGSLLWDKTWGGGSYDWADSIIAIADGGLIISGEAYSFGDGSSEAFFAKFSANGVLADCLAPMCQDPKAITLDPSATTQDLNAIETDPTATELDPLAIVIDPSASTLDIIQENLPPTMPFVFSNQELYVAYPGNNKTACKQWTATEGVIKGFAVNHATEGGYDFVAVSVDGVQRYNGSNTRTRYVNISDNPGTTIEICITTDVGYKGGFGGEITGLIYN